MSELQWIETRQKWRREIERLEAVLRATADQADKAAFAAALAYQSTERNPWRQAVDEALIAHALDCTGPGDDPKEKVKELIEWAVTIATDPRVSETAAREQEASATGAEPVVVEARAVYALCESIEQDQRDDDYTRGMRTMARRIRKEVAALATPTTSTTGKVDASRVRDEALEEAAQLYGEGEVAAPGGHSPWGETHQEGWIDGTKAYRDAIRSLIGTPKSAEGEGA